MLSYQSLMPVTTGTPRYEKPELWLGTANWHRGFCHTPPRPLRGTSPSPREVFDSPCVAFGRATFSYPAIGHQSTIRQFAPVESRHQGLLKGASRIGVRDMLSYQSLMPVTTGTPRYEKPELWLGTANWHRGFCHTPPRPLRGTSPSPREVFDSPCVAFGRATFSYPAIGHQSTIRQFAPVESRHQGLLKGASRIGVRDMLSYQSLMPVTTGTPRYEKPELWLGTANWHRGFCHTPPRPLRGTSPSPREVFDSPCVAFGRATFSHSAIGHRSTIRHVSPMESRHRG